MAGRGAFSLDVKVFFVHEYKFFRPLPRYGIFRETPPNNWRRAGHTRFRIQVSPAIAPFLAIVTLCLFYRAISPHFEPCPRSEEGGLPLFPNNSECPQ